MNYSFWADEAYIAGIAMQWTTGKLPFITLLTTAPGITYQRLQMFIVGIFFKLFGISEFTARLPSLITFIIGVVIIFFLAKKLSNIYGGILSAFLYGFSHLNLAHAFQAKPYTAIETIMLCALLLLANNLQEKKKGRIIFSNVGMLILLCIATLLHVIGFLLWILYACFIIQTLKRLDMEEILTKYKWYIFATFITIGGVLIPIILPYFAYKLFPYNNGYQVIKLFTFKYAIITGCSVIGFFLQFKKQRSLSTTILIYSLIVLVLATFQQYIFNIRYVLTIFGILFLYFGVFWAKVGEKYDNNLKFSIFNLRLSGKAIIPLTVLVLLYTTGYKIVRWPQAYYNPNIDKYGDVQIANYKDFYGELKQKFPDYKNMYVVNDTFDVEYWYFGRYSNAYFMKFTDKPYKHHTADAMIHGSLSDFKKMMKEHPQGLLIMEDWQSFLPDDVKEYAKKNLKLEFRVESLKEAPDDPWPLALYSWGL
ncbi:MAG: glycosyltransferase family 39 protein [Microgenomates group bacterium]